jgi:hypothetical protein
MPPPFGQQWCGLQAACGERIAQHQTQEITLVDPKPERTLPFKQSNFDYVKKGMEGVLRPGGTGWRVGSGLQYTMGGKTGTAQVKSIAQGKSYNAAALAVQHRDHAWFISLLLPVDKPKIAIAVILENGGWGATAAPVARQLTDFYLLKILGQGTAEELSTPQGMSVLADETLISKAAKPRWHLYRPLLPPPPSPTSSIRCETMISDNHPFKRLQQIMLDPIDKWMILAMLIIYVMSLFLLYSADGQEFVQLEKKTLHTFIGFLLLWGLARIKPQILASLALPAYIGGVVLLVAVELFGVTVNGSTRWLDIGPIRIQPSEIMKIGLPMMVAWYFQRYDTDLRWYHYLGAIGIIMVPVALILKQPDLGTATLIMASGLFVVFFAGLSWRVFASPSSPPLPPCL